jgi:hypothetical protein
MSRNFYGSICLTDIIQQARELDPSFSKAKNEKVYVSVNVWINDQEDKFGNKASIKISDKDEVKGIYIGNLKEGKSGSSSITKDDSDAILEGMEDLPF